MPPRTGSQTQKANGGRGASAGRSTGRGAGRTSGRGNSTAAGRGAGRNGRTGRGGGKTGGRGNKDNGFTAKKDVDLDEGLDECESRERLLCGEKAQCINCNAAG